MKALKVRDLTPNPKNPRKISDAKLEQLKRALLEFGDLSGIVFNRQSGQLVGGHQRSKVLDPGAEVTVVKRYPKPTKTGTVAEGYVIDYTGERYDWKGIKTHGARPRLLRRHRRALGEIYGRKAKLVASAKDPSPKLRKKVVEQQESSIDGRA